MPKLNSARITSWAVMATGFILIGGALFHHGSADQAMTMRCTAIVMFGIAFVLQELAKWGRL